MVCVCIKYNPYLKGALFRKYLGCMYCYTFGAADTLAVGAVKVAVFFGRQLSAVPLGPGRGGRSRARRGEGAVHGREAGRRGSRDALPCIPMFKRFRG